MTSTDPMETCGMCGGRGCVGCAEYEGTGQVPRYIGAMRRLPDPAAQREAGRDLAEMLRQERNIMRQRAGARDLVLACRFGGE